MDYTRKCFAYDLVVSVVSLYLIVNVRIHIYINQKTTTIKHEQQRVATHPSVSETVWPKIKHCRYFVTFISAKSEILMWKVY